MVGNIIGLPDGGDYTGTMLPFYQDIEAMNAISAINIMSYGTCIDNFYSKLDLVSNILNAFNFAGVPKKKIIFGVQPYECGTHSLLLA